MQNFFYRLGGGGSTQALLGPSLPAHSLKKYPVGILSIFGPSQTQNFTHSHTKGRKKINKEKYNKDFLE